MLDLAVGEVYIEQQITPFKVAGGVFNIHEIHQLFSVNIDRPACNE